MENNNIDQIIAERNDRDLDNLVVVLSRNYSTGLSVVRSLGSAGYTVDLVASAFRRDRSELVACSKYVRDSVEVVSKKVKDGDDLKLLDALLAYAGRYDHKPVLFPTDDYTTSIMDLNKSLLEDIFIMPEIIGGGDGSMTRSMDKRVQSDLAKKAGLPLRGAGGHGEHRHPPRARHRAARPRPGGDRHPGRHGISLFLQAYRKHHRIQARDEDVRG